MNHEIQKANFWKRIAAWMFDAIMVSVLVVGCGFLLSILLGYDSYNATLEESFARYETQYSVEFDISISEYEAMTEAEQANYDTAYAALIADEEAVYAYNMVMSLTLTIASLAVLLGILIWEFLMPLWLGDGRTLGKKIFGLAVVRIDGVKLNNFQLFTRTILGKYAIETMIPVCVLLMLFWGTTGLFGTLFLFALLLVQLGCLAFNRNRSAIHDLLAGTVVVDYAAQTIFKSTDDLIAYQKKLAADRAARTPY